MNVTIDDRSPQFIYKSRTSGWTQDHTASNNTILYFDQTFYATPGEGDTASLEFNGTAIYVYGSKRNYHGTFSVEIDNQPIEYLSGYDVGFTFQQLIFSKDGLDDQPHKITLTNLPSRTTETPVVSPVRWWLDIDYVQITIPKTTEVYTTIIDDTSPSVKYTGSGWSNTTSYHKSYYNTTAKFGDEVGDTMDLSFSGSSIQVFGSINKDHGSFQVSLDGVPVADTFDGYYFNAQLQTPLYTASNLVDGPHNLTIRNNGGGRHSDGLDFDYAVVNSTIKPEVTQAAPPAGTALPNNPGSGDTTSSNNGGSADSSSNNNGNSTGQSNGLPKGAIIGGVVGGITALAIIGILVWILTKLKRNEKEKRYNNQSAAIDLTGEEIKPFQGNGSDDYHGDSTHLQVQPFHGNGTVPSQSRSDISPTETNLTGLNQSQQQFSLNVPPPPRSNATSYPRTETDYPHSTGRNSSIGGAFSIAPSSNTFGHAPSDRNHTDMTSPGNSSNTHSVNRYANEKQSLLSLNNIREERNEGISDLDLDFSGTAPPQYSEHSPSGSGSNQTHRQ